MSNQPSKEALDLMAEVGSLVIKARRLGYEIKVEFNGQSEYPTLIMSEVPLPSWSKESEDDKA